MLKDTKRFILVRAKCPYVQFATAARVISTKRFVVGDTKGRERDRSQVSDRKVERTLRAGCCSAMCYVMRGVLNRSPLVGCPALPFIDQGGAGITDGRKKKK